MPGDHIDMPRLKVPTGSSARSPRNEPPDQIQVDRAVEEAPDGPSCRYGIAYFHKTLQKVTCLIEPMA